MATIVHLDMDAFFAAVEELDNPAYRGKPLIVGGSSSRGVVSTCSYAARAFGVHSAMPMAQARKLCPQGIFIPPRMERYQEVSAQLFQLLGKFTPLVEPLSIDEAFLDLTGCEHFYVSWEDMASTMQRTIKEHLHLTCSIGLAPNKFLAKIASGYRKPAGITIIRPSEVEDFLQDLPVESLWGVGAKTRDKLKTIGVRTIGDLKKLSLDYLTRLLGKNGGLLYQLARGIDERPVEPQQEMKSLGAERTFPKDLHREEDITAALLDLASQVGRRLRKEHLTCRTMTLKVRYPDFTTITKSKTLPQWPTDDYSLFQGAQELFQQVPRGQYRLLGIYLSGLAPYQQMELFSEGRDTLNQVLDGLNERYGRYVIGPARLYRKREK
ncbi:MAG: DNA polymerase IV [Limnochordia bacterium]